MKMNYHNLLKIKTFFTLLALFVILLVDVFAFQSKGIETKKIFETVIIDGNIDNAWNALSWYSIENIIKGNINDLENLPKFKICYDDKNLYIFVKVNDDYLKENNSIKNYLKSDSVSLFFDINVKKSSKLDNNNFQLSFTYNNNYIFSREGVKTSIINHKWKKTEDGYNFEVQIPYSILNIEKIKEKNGISFNILINNFDGKDNNLFSLNRNLDNLNTRINIYDYEASYIDYNQIKINFSPSKSDLFEGYYLDNGDIFGEKENGLKYGWKTNAKKDAVANKKYNISDSYIKIKENNEWSIELEDGYYSIELCIGDGINIQNYEVIINNKSFLYNLNKKDSHLVIYENIIISKFTDNKISISKGKYETKLNYIIISNNDNYIYNCFPPEDDTYLKTISQIKKVFGNEDYLLVNNNSKKNGNEKNKTISLIEFNLLDLENIEKAFLKLFLKDINPSKKQESVLFCYILNNYDFDEKTLNWDNSGLCLTKRGDLILPEDIILVGDIVIQNCKNHYFELEVTEIIKNNKSSKVTFFVISKDLTKNPASFFSKEIGFNKPILEIITEKQIVTYERVFLTLNIDNNFIIKNYERTFLVDSHFYDINDYKDINIKITGYFDPVYYSQSSVNKVIIENLTVIPPEKPVFYSKDWNKDGFPVWEWSIPEGTFLFRCKLDNDSWIETKEDYFKPDNKLSEEMHRMVLECKNRLSQWSESVEKIITVDITKPQLQKFNYQKLVNSKTPSFSWEATDNICKVSELLYEYAIDDMVNIPSNKPNYVPDQGLDDGEHIFKIRVCDKAGNWSDDYNYSFTVDTTPPTEPLFTVQLSTSSKTSTIKWNSSDNITLKKELYVEFCFNNGEIIKGTGLSEYTSDCELEDGSYDLVVRVRDLAGNWSNPGKYTLVIDLSNNNIAQIEYKGLQVIFPKLTIENCDFEIQNIGKIHSEDPNIKWISDCFKLGPDRTFNEYIGLSFDCSKFSIPEEIDKNRLKVHYWDELNNSWKSIVSVYDTELDKIMGWTKHFSYFSITDLSNYDTTYNTQNIGLCHIPDSSAFHKNIFWFGDYLISCPFESGYWPDARSISFVKKKDGKIVRGENLTPGLVNEYGVGAKRVQLWMGDYKGGLHNIALPIQIILEKLILPFPFYLFGCMDGVAWGTGAEICIYELTKDLVYFDTGGDIAARDYFQNKYGGGWKFTNPSEMEFVLVQKSTNLIITSASANHTEFWENGVYKKKWVNPTWWLNMWSDPWGHYRITYDDLVLYYRVKEFWGNTWQKWYGSLNSVNEAPIPDEVKTVRFKSQNENLPVLNYKWIQIDDEGNLIWEMSQSYNLQILGEKDCWFNFLYSEAKTGDSFALYCTNPPQEAIRFEHFDTSNFCYFFSSEGFPVRSDYEAQGTIHNEYLQDLFIDNDSLCGQRDVYKRFYIEGHEQNMFVRVYDEFKGEYSPQARNISISGNFKVGETVSVKYDFWDKNSHNEKNRFIKWDYEDEYDLWKEIKRESETCWIPPECGGKQIRVKVLVQCDAGHFSEDACYAYAKIEEYFPPVAKNLKIQGEAMVGMTLCPFYDYSSLQNTPEKGSIVEWYESSTENGSYSFITRKRNFRLVYDTYSDREDKNKLFKNQWIKFRVTPIDALGAVGDYVESAPVQVVDQKPYVKDVYISGDPLPFRTLHGLFKLRDADRESIRAECQWYYSDSKEETYRMIINTMGRTSWYVEPEYRDKWIKFSVIPVNDILGDKVYSEPVLILNHPPFITNLKIDKTEPIKIGNKLSVSYIYSDLEDDAQGETKIQWLHVLQESLLTETIFGATGKELTITPEYNNKWIRVQVIPADNRGSCGVKYYSEIIRLYFPEAKDVRISENLLSIGRIFEGHYDFVDGDGDIEGESNYQWFISDDKVNFTPISGAKNRTLEFNTEYADKWIKFGVTPVDVNRISGTIFYSDTILINNRPPIVSNINISGILLPNNTLKLSYVYSDPDGHLEGATKIQWLYGNYSSQVNADIPGATSKEYIITSEYNNKWIGVSIIPIDEHGSMGASLSGFPVLIDNPLPSANNVKVKSSPYCPGKNLIIEYDYFDPENQTEGNSIFLWYIADSKFSSFEILQESTNKSLYIPVSFRGKWLQVAVIPVDEYGAKGIFAPGEKIEIVNSGASAQNVIITGTKKPHNVLSATYEYVDEEKDPEGDTYFYWIYSDSETGIYTKIENTDNITSFCPDDKYQGKWIKFKVYPKDSFDDCNGYVTSSPVYIQVIPVAKNVSISGITKINNFIKGNYEFISPESITEGYSTFQWYVSETESGDYQTIPGANQTSFELDEKYYNKWIKFSVIPVDTQNVSGNISFSGTVKISNNICDLEYLGSYSYYSSEEKIGGANYVQVSPEGKHVYVSGYYSNSIIWFIRDDKDGSLIYKGSYESHSIKEIKSFTITQDGKFIYVPSFNNGIVWFKRDAETGNLTFIDSFVLGNPEYIKISPDSNHIYSYSNGAFNSSIFIFSRDSITGNIKFINNPINIKMRNLNGIAITEDGRFVYVLDQYYKKILLFHRDLITGLLTFYGEYQNENMMFPISIIISKNNKDIYISNYGGSESFNKNILWFKINTSDGSISFQDAYSVEEIYNVWPLSLCISNNEKNVYFSFRNKGTDPDSGGCNLIAWFERDILTGELVYIKKFSNVKMSDCKYTTVSGDDKNVYAVNFLISSVLWFKPKSCI